MSKQTSEHLHFRFLKRLLWLPKRTSNWTVLSETGRYPITLRISESMIKYILHIKNTTSPILKSAFETSVQLAGEGYNSWFKSISKLLKLMNLEQLLSMSNDESRGEIATLKASLKDTYDNVWREEREEHFNNSKLDFLVSLKDTFVISPHLTKCKGASFRAAITKIRTSAHKFPVETGRYENIPRENRLCPFGCNIVGGESHYMFECKHPLIENIYKPIIKDITKLHPGFGSLGVKAKCKLVLNSEDSQTINLVGRLCYQIQDIFKILTY